MCWRWGVGEVMHVVFAGDAAEGGYEQSLLGVRVSEGEVSEE